MGHGNPKQVTQKPQQPAGGQSASHSSMPQQGPADGVRAQLRLRERAVGAPTTQRPANTPRSPRAAVSGHRGQRRSDSDGADARGAAHHHREDRTA